MNKAYLTLYGILAFWVAVLIGVFAFHIAVPIRFLFLMAFLCVGWLAWWTITTVRRTILGEKSPEESATEAIKTTQPEKPESENASEQKHYV
jgi:type VI protein secretion system component VasK